MKRKPLCHYINQTLLFMVISGTFAVGAYAICEDFIRPALCDGVLIEDTCLTHDEIKRFS